MILAACFGWLSRWNIPLLPRVCRLRAILFGQTFMVPSIDVISQHSLLLYSLTSWCFHLRASTNKLISSDQRRRSQFSLGFFSFSLNKVWWCCFVLKSKHGCFSWTPSSEADVINCPLNFLSCHRNSELLKPPCDKSEADARLFFRAICESSAPSMHLLQNDSSD